MSKKRNKKATDNDDINIAVANAEHMRLKCIKGYNDMPLRHIVKRAINYYADRYEADHPDMKDDVARHEGGVSA